MKLDKIVFHAALAVSISLIGCGQRLVAQAAPDLHVLIIADVEDPGIGAGARVDLDRIEELFRKHVPGGKTREIRTFFGKAFLQEEVINHLMNMPLGEQTGVVLYFSGHGDYTPKDGHRMAIPTRSDEEGRLPNEQIFRLLQQRRQSMRLVAVITDSCAPNVGLPPHRQTARSIGSAVRAQNVLKPVNELFYKAKGLVDINGCSEHQSAFGPAETGGFFTVGFVKALDDNSIQLVDDLDGDGVLTWNEFFGRAIRHTEDQFAAAVRRYGTLKGPDGRAQHTQTPQAFLLPSHPPLGRFRLGVYADSAPKGGVSIKGVTAGTPASSFLQKDDIIVAINGKTVRSVSDFTCIMDYLPRPEIQVRYVRNGKEMAANVTMQMIPK